MSRHQNRDEWIEEETDILRYNGFSMRDSIRIANATADELDKKNNGVWNNYDSPSHVDPVYLAHNRGGRRKRRKSKKTRKTKKSRKTRRKSTRRR